MPKNYKFPRVEISQFARVQATPTSTAPDVVPLLIPIVSPIGPDDKIVRITSLTEYYDNFGVPSYEDMGVTAILIMRWLAQGGTIYAYRMVNNSAEAKYTFNRNISEGKSFSISFDAKYKGTKYNNINFSITPTSVSSDRYNIKIELPGIKTSLVGSTKLVEEYSNLQRGSIGKILASSSKIVKNFKFEVTGVLTNEEINEEIGSTIILEKTNYDDDGFDALNYYEKYESLLVTRQIVDDQPVVEIDDSSTFIKALMSVNQTPVDMIIDVGFPDTLKYALYKAASYVIEETERGLLVVFSTYCFDITPSGNVPIQSDIIEGYNSNISGPIVHTKTLSESEFIEDAYRIGWCAVFDGYLTLTDNIFGSNDEVFTPLTLPLALNVLYNTQNYSYHRPTAGTTYGRLNNFKNLNGNGPTTSQKDALFRNRINYAEKDGDNIDIMTNRTFAHTDSDNKQTPLDFINNVRVKNKIMRDLSVIMKKYLYEYSDGDTLLKCYTECNSYLNSWINNKALTSANVLIELDSETEEYMYATLTIKFRGTVEYINLRLVIE